MTAADGDRGGAGALDLEGSGHWLTSEGGLRCDSGLAVTVDDGECSACGTRLIPVERIVDAAVEAAVAAERERVAAALDSEGHHWSGERANAYFHAAVIARGLP